MIVPFVAPPATVHLIGICGTGMGSLAGLLVKKGYRVTGSDSAAYPPMSVELKRLGVEIQEGYRAENLSHRPDLVIVGNVCRSDHPEAVAAQEMGIPRASLPKALLEIFLKESRPIVITGTHGKTTTTALTAYLLQAAGKDPSLFLGGVAADFNAGYRLGGGSEFVVEGDEYDSAFFEKVPKFLSYAPAAAVITSIEYDHIDIYPSFDAYKSAFASFVDLIEPPGPLAAYAGDETARDLAKQSRADTILYGVEGDPLPPNVDWLAVPVAVDTFDLIVQGRMIGTFESALNGYHNMRNALAALIMCHGGAAVSFELLKKALPGFGGVARRQQILAQLRGITVYDDFAHHPTAVYETLRALAALHPQGRLLAAYEPRSATACRRLHQATYAKSFDLADKVVIAPLGRVLPDGEGLDTRKLARELNDLGIHATATESIDEVLEEIVSWARPGDGVVLFSNGDFGGLPARLIEELR